MSTPFSSSRHQRALAARSSLRRIVRATFARGSTSEILVPSAGSLTQDARRSMVWGGSLALELATDDPLLPLAPTDLLTPFGTTVSMDVGIELSDGTEETVAYGTYVVTSTKIDVSAGRRTVTISLADLAVTIAGYRFETPLVVAGDDIAGVVNAVILDRTGTDPGLADVGETVGSSVFGNDTGTDPWAELQSVVASRGYRLRYSRAGALSLTPAPDYLNDIPEEFDSPLGVSASFDSRPPNVLVARGEAADGTAPSLGIAMDDDPSSPTYAGASVGSSPYGRITQFYASRFLASDAQALAAAEAILARKVGAGASWELSRAFDPTIDIDDLLSVPSVPSVPPLAVDSVTVDITGATSITGRAVTV